MFQKKIAVLSALMIISLFLISCGKSDNNAADEGTEPKLVGSLSEIMDSIYENADLSQDFRDAMEGFDSGEIPSVSDRYSRCGVYGKLLFHSYDKCCPLPMHPVESPGGNRHGNRQNHNQGPC